MPIGFAIVNKGKILAEYPWNQLSIFEKKATAEYILGDVKKQFPDAEIMEVSIGSVNEMKIPDWAQ